MSGPIAIGVGCRRACPADEIERLVTETCQDLSLDGAAIFTIEAKREEPGLHDAALSLALPLRFLPAAALEAVLGAVSIHSDRAAEAVGISSVAEASALAGAGAGARLIVSRMASRSATCAVAVGDSS